jgi:AraC-like DNA-binding protein
MPVWEVSRLPEPDQFEYWREVICQAFVPLTPGRKDAGPGFPSTVETRPLMGINRARIASRAQTTRHGPREVSATDDAFYFVNLQLAGRCRTRVGPTDDVVHPGQFVLVDTTRPYYFDFDDDWRMLSFRVPHQLLRPTPSGPPPRLGVPIDSHGVGGVVTSLMRALWDVDDAAEPAAMRELEQAFAHAVLAAATPVEHPTTPRATLRAAVMRYVQDHLTDSALSVTSVCRQFAISPRTLHNLFTDVDGTFAATVRALRLDRCARELADPATVATVAAVAAEHGFQDPTTFTRAFRRRFGCRPSDLRGVGQELVAGH